MDGASFSYDKSAVCDFKLASDLSDAGCRAHLLEKIAYPDKQVLAVCGDGGFAMTMADFITAVKYNLPLVVVLFNNHKIGMIKFEQEVMGNVEFGTDLTNPNFARYADICGGVGYRVEKEEELLPAFEKCC